MNFNPPVNKKSKKIQSKGKAKNSIFDNDPIFRRLAELEDNEDEAEQQRNAKKKTKRKTQPSATITSSSNTQPNTSQQIDEDASENELRTLKKRSTSQSPGSSQKKSGSASKPYTPKPGSGGYAILLALYNNRDKKF